MSQVRNFWLSADVDGRATEVSGGPRSKDGGLSATFYIRDEGSILEAVQVRAWAHSDGTLSVSAYVMDDAQRRETAEVTREDNGFTITTKRDAPQQRRRNTVSRAVRASMNAINAEFSWSDPMEWSPADATDPTRV
jgi:hypothetical protein